MKRYIGGIVVLLAALGLGTGSSGATRTVEAAAFGARRAFQDGNLRAALGRRHGSGKPSHAAPGHHHVIGFHARILRCRAVSHGLALWQPGE